MADDDGAANVNNELTLSASQVENAPTNASAELPASSPVIVDNRTTLIEHARNFLNSPRIVHEDFAAKRRFLTEKGLSDIEIEGLLRELPPQLPAVPPRTYPKPPPSNLPYLLMGLFKVLTWVTGSSAVLILIYYRFLLPRLTRSALARRSLKEHQVSLLKQLNNSIAELRSTQKETFAVLPPPPPFRELEEYADIHSLEKLEELEKEGGEKGRIDRETGVITIPPFTFLRCAIEGLAMEGKKLTKEELFTSLEEKFPWLRSEDGIIYQTSLWNTLIENTRFTEEASEDGKPVWSYTPPLPPSPTSLESSLDSLKSAISSATSTKATSTTLTSIPTSPNDRPSYHQSPFQRTQETLSEFLGYITTQTWQLFSTSMRMYSPGLGVSGNGTLQSPQQEEIRKEIRALKGLVLNRRTFAPASLRSPVHTSPVQSP